MIAAMMQMFSGGEPLKEETIFDIEFTDEHLIDEVYCQVQFNFTPLDGNDAIGVDWGDGVRQDWSAPSYILCSGATTWSPPRGRSAPGAASGGQPRSGGVR